LIFVDEGEESGGPYRRGGIGLLREILIAEEGGTGEKERWIRRGKSEKKSSPIRDPFAT